MYHRQEAPFPGATLPAFEGTKRHARTARWHCALILLCFAGLAACHKPNQVVLTGETMGTTWTVKAKVSPGEKNRLQGAIEQRLLAINNAMSTWDERSELSRFNQSPINEKFLLSADLAEVMQLAHEIHQASDGAFDVTVGPLVNVWGFGPSGARSTPPAAAEIESALARTGFSYLVLEDTSITKTADVYVDLSAIAKGYAVDQIAALLDSFSITDYLVEIGGELYARGSNPGGRAWSVAIEKPDAISRTVFTVMPLVDSGMATSGDYRNYFETDGVRYSHTIDPRTGRPITHNVASVTVLAASSAEADAWATALNVLGADRGMELAVLQNLKVLVIMKAGVQFTEVASPALQAYLQHDEKPE